MESQTAGVFKIDYTMFTRANGDIQFGMDFTLTNRGNLALAQLIFPATAVGTNLPGRWNIDNHRPGNDPLSLIFQNAQEGRIHDTPRELSHADQGVKSTKFAVYRVDLEKAEVQGSGVQFGYSINTSDPNPVTQFGGFSTSVITNEQKQTLQARCNFIKFV